MVDNVQVGIAVDAEVSYHLVRHKQPAAAFATLHALHQLRVHHLAHTLLGLCSCFFFSRLTVRISPMPVSSKDTSSDLGSYARE